MKLVSHCRARLAAFGRDDAGAATVEWIALGALCVSLAVAIGIFGQIGTGGGSRAIVNEISDATYPAATATVVLDTALPQVGAADAPRSAAAQVEAPSNDRFRLRNGELIWSRTQSPYAAGIGADVIVTTTHGPRLVNRAAPSPMAQPLTLVVNDCRDAAPGSVATADGTVCETRRPGVPRY